MRFVDNVTSANIRMLPAEVILRGTWLAIQMMRCEFCVSFYCILVSGSLSSSSMRIVLFLCRTIRDADTGLISYISMVCNDKSQQVTEQNSTHYSLAAHYSLADERDKKKIISLNCFFFLHVFVIFGFMAVQWNAFTYGLDFLPSFSAAMKMSQHS